MNFEWLISGLSVAVGTFAAALISRFFAKEKEKRKKQESEFITTLLGAMKSGTVKDMDDVLGVYRAVRGEGFSASITKGYIIPWLENTILELHKIKPTETDKKEEVLRQLGFLKVCTKELADQEPFSDLPETEKNLMTDVLVFGKNGQDKFFVSKLHDLGHVIKTRYEENNKLRETTKWSVPISIIGIIVSIAFGLYTIFGR